MLHPVLHPVLHTLPGGALFGTVLACPLELALTLSFLNALTTQVPEYKGLWKPKHHFATHLAVEIMRAGPLRGFWCMSFEGFNKVVKQATEISNYRNEDIFVLEHWMMRSAKVLRGLRDEALRVRKTHA